MRDSGGHVSTGDLYMFAAAICTSIGYVYSGRLSQQMPGWEVICWIPVLALPVTAPSALWLMPQDVFVISARAWSGFAYVSLFSMLIGYFAWNAALAMGGVARVSQVQLLQTFITLALAAIVNGERLDPLTVGAAVAVVVIVALGSRARVGSG
ncbi:MAG: DMT family transporter [Casimicrobiaceae bacterium]